MAERRAWQRALAVSHTTIAAGINRASQRPPPYSASIPKSTRRAAKHRDSFDVVFMIVLFIS
jgi:hypothetical protein